MLNFNDNELQVITKGLSNLPWIEANPVINKIAQHVADRTRRAALPDPLDEPKPWEKLADKIEKEAFSQTPEQANAIRKQIFVTTDAQLEHAKAMEPVSRKAKRAALMRILKAKGSAELSTAEIARRAGVSYVTAMKARAAFATPAKKGRK